MNWLLTAFLIYMGIGGLGAGLLALFSWSQGGRFDDDALFAFAKVIVAWPYYLVVLFRR